MTRDLHGLWLKNPTYTRHSVIYEETVRALSEELENKIYEKCDQKVNDRYRYKVGKAKKNLELISTGYPEVSQLFMKKKIDVSKLKSNYEKFKKTC